MSPFDLRSHTADVAVAATGETLAETFASVAAGLTEAHCEGVPAGTGDRFRFPVAAESREALLFDYLDELIYQRDVRNVLPADHEVAIEAGSDADGRRTGGEEDAVADSEWRLEATARGVPLTAVDAREIKAVTYSEMVLEETPTGWRAYVVFDV
jgi:SHS2 domain-containing protein